MHGGNPALPRRYQRRARHSRLFIGVNEMRRSDQNARMLGSAIRPPAKQKQISRPCLGKRQGRPEQSLPGVDQPVLATALRPIGGVGRNRFRLLPLKLTPDTPDEADAIAADALRRTLMPVRRADPACRQRNDPVVHPAHSNIGLPSWTRSPSA